MWYRKKRIYAALLVVVLLVLYVDRAWLGRWMYPIRYEQTIVEQALAHGVDPYLMAAIIRVESNFRNDKVSSKGAVGLMQLMPQTAQWIIRETNGDPADIDMLDDPELNIRYGAWYIRSLKRQFVEADMSKEQEIALIAAAYNAGPGNVRKWLGENLWDGTLACANRIPFGETRHYIHRVHYYYVKFAQTYPELGGGPAEGVSKDKETLKGCAQAQPPNAS